MQTIGSISSVYVSLPVRRFAARRLAEIFGFFLLTGSIAFSFALASWSVEDPSWNHATHGPVRNFLGSFGAIIADLAMQLLGLGALALLAVWVIWGWRLMRHHALPNAVARLFLAFIGVLAVAGVASALPKTNHWPLPTGLGGVFGDALLALPYRFASHSAITTLVAMCLLAVMAILSLTAACAWNDKQALPDMKDDIAPAKFNRESIDDDRDGEPGFGIIILGLVVHAGLSLQGWFRRSREAHMQAKKAKSQSASVQSKSDAAASAKETPIDMPKTVLVEKHEPVIEIPTFDPETYSGKKRPLSAPIQATVIENVAVAAFAPAVPETATVPVAAADVWHEPVSLDLPTPVVPREEVSMPVTAKRVEPQLPMPDPEPAQPSFIQPIDELAQAHRTHFVAAVAPSAPVAVRAQPVANKPVVSDLSPEAIAAAELQPAIRPSTVPPESSILRPNHELHRGFEPEHVLDPHAAASSFDAYDPQPDFYPQSVFTPESVAPRPAASQYQPSPRQLTPAPAQPVSSARPAPIVRAPLAQTHVIGAQGGTSYEPPSLELLAEPKLQSGHRLSQDALDQNARALEGVLDDFNVKGEIIHVHPGPVVTLYELEPAPGVKSSRVINLADDIARSMSAISARVAVVQGRNAIGVELPNHTRETVYLRELIASEAFEHTKHKLAIALGKTIGGEPVIVDLARMPHLLVAGTTGSGKSVAINTMILSILYRLRPDECRLIMVDPKMLELSVYDGIPHLLTPVVTDPKKAVVALKWAVREMEDRYKKMSRVGVRNIDGFNVRVLEAQAKGEMIHRIVQTGFDQETGEAIYEQEEMDLQVLPYIVVIVDEMADLMMVAGKDIEGAIQRLAQMARAAGIHLIMATQRPSVDVITGTIKANFPTRISFQVTSKIDSRTILGEQGAEQLLGQGDMLYMAGGGRISRVHGPFVSDHEVEKIVAYLKTQGQPDYLDAIVNEDVVTEGGEAPVGSMDAEESGDLYDRAVAIVLRDRKCSTSYIQRRLSVGYNKAASLVERMEQEGVVSPANHAGKREILVGAGVDRGAFDPDNDD